MSGRGRANPARIIESNATIFAGTYRRVMNKSSRANVWNNNITRTQTHPCSCPQAGKAAAGVAQLRQVRTGI